MESEEEQLIKVTESAKDKILKLLIDENNYNLKLRIYIIGGGCAGFEYGFSFDEDVNEDDLIIKYVIDKNEDNQNNKNNQNNENISNNINSISILVDALSLNYLINAEIDYIEDLQGARFVVNNPNAKTTCGCGSSFSI